MRRRIVVSAFALALLFTSRVACAEDDEVRARLHPEPTVWPGIFGATGLALGGASFWFFFQTGRYADRNEKLREDPFRVVVSEQPCHRANDPEYCSIDEKMDLALTLGWSTLAGSAVFLGTAVIAYVVDPAPSKSAKGFDPVIRF